MSKNRLQWTLNEAIDVIRRLQPFAHQYGFSLSLGGGVLNNGSSYKDLDIVALHFHGPDISDEVKLLKLFDRLYYNDDEQRWRDGSEKYDGKEAEARATQKDTLYIFDYDIPGEHKRIDLFVIDRKSEEIEVT